MAVVPTRIEAVLFDLGGTLVNEHDFELWTAVARSVRVDVEPDTLRHAYLEVEREVDADPIGPPRARSTSAEFWRRVLARATERELDAALGGRFLDALAAAPPPKLPVYSDARRCLQRLRAGRRRLGVVSNSVDEPSARAILRAGGIDGYFQLVVSSGSEGVAKPDPELFRRAVARLGVPRSSTLYVGNLEHGDAIAAREAGLRSVWLNREGTGFSETTPEITTLLEVPMVVQGLETGRLTDTLEAARRLK